MPDEPPLRLSCEIQYGTKVGQKIPDIFWFDDIYDVICSNKVFDFITFIFVLFFLSFVALQMTLKKLRSILSHKSTVEIVQ